MNIWHPWQLKKIKSWWPIQPIYLKNGPNGRCCLAGGSKTAPRILIFFNSHGCQTFILYEINCYLSPLKSWHNNSFLGSVSLYCLQGYRIWNFLWDQGLTGLSCGYAPASQREETKTNKWQQKCPPPQWQPKIDVHLIVCEDKGEPCKNNKFL